MPKQGMGVLRRQTTYFIEQNPTDLVLSREVKADDGAGGSTTTATDLEVQTVRLVRPAPTTAVERRTIGGEMVKPTLSVVGEYDSDMRRGDTFTYQGLDMEIVWVNDMGYEKVGEAAVR